MRVANSWNGAIGRSGDRNCGSEKRKFGICLAPSPGLPCCGKGERRANRTGGSAAGQMRQAARQRHRPPDCDRGRLPSWFRFEISECLSWLVCQRCTTGSRASHSRIVCCPAKHSCPCEYNSESPRVCTISSIPGPIVDAGLIQNRHPAAALMRVEQPV